MQLVKLNNANSNYVIKIHFLMQLFKLSHSNWSVNDSNSVSSDKLVLPIQMYEEATSPKGSPAQHYLACMDYNFKVGKMILEASIGG